MPPKLITRKSKPEDFQFTIQEPQEGCWWRYLEPEALNIFQNQPDRYGLLNIPEAMRCQKMIGKRYQKMECSKQYVLQWLGKNPGGKLLRIRLTDLQDTQYEIDQQSGLGFVLGEALIRQGKLMRSTDELKRASEALLYEYRMLLASAGFLGSQIARDSDLALCVLESFLVHLRNLLGFFYSEPKWDSDCSVGDYLPDVVAWRQKAEGYLLLPTDQILRRIHKDLAHLTYDRIDKDIEDRLWEVTEIALAVVRVMTAFRQDVSHKDSFSTEWDSRWHELERLEGTLSGQNIVLGS